MQQTTDILGAALAHHQAGRLGDAKAGYEQLLAREPAHPDALHFLGLLTCQAGQQDEGIALMRRSIDAYPSAIYHNNLGNALRERGRLDDAIAQYREAVRRQPDYAEAHNNLGDALREARQPDASMQHCAQAIALRPDYAQAYNNLGNALKDLGQSDAAVLAYGKAIEHDPRYADAYNNLGNVLTTQRKFDAAVDSYRAAVALNPGRAIVHGNLGTALLARGDLDESIATLRRAVELDPLDPQVHNCLGSALREAGRNDEAIVHFERVIELSGGDVDAHLNLSRALKSQNRIEESVEAGKRAIELDPRRAEGYVNLAHAYYWLDRVDDAIVQYRRALEFDPDSADIHQNLSIALCQARRVHEALESAQAAVALEPGTARRHAHLADVLRKTGDVDAAIKCYRRALECDPDNPGTYTSLLFCLAGQTDFDPDAYLADARVFGARMSMHAKPWRHQPAPLNGRRLRVGFVSGDFRRHPVGIFLESVVAHLDRSRVELVAFTTFDTEDDYTARLKPHFDGWHRITDLGTEQTARRIHDERIDVLVDLAGHTAHNRLPAFAWKPAPIQVSWLGFFASTGIAEMDYFLGDAHVLPAAEEAHFVERPWRLPDSYLCFTPPPHDVQVGPLPMLRNGHITFGCFGKLVKVTDDVVRVWSRLLHAVPGAKLLLKAYELAVEDICDATRARFAAHGIGADRLILEQGSSRDAYFAAYNRADVMLSPFPYPGGTTTAESLWMGVPVLGMKGERFVTHICESLLHAAGLGDWIASDEADYIAKAVAFSRDRGELAAMRAGLRQQMQRSPLGDAKRFARHLEDAFHGMWDAWLAGTPEDAPAR
ncbi:tetratricopeptide repeat protein [Burkholderia territorii]|uniref:tetratricopeptide repeat protein n=1 Tax=Burkholderia territorii TaxID=1503055 RepID=UPI00075C1E97|nr:tetratricopeptide repeat protein [Burkholderia territorii]KWA33388.1 hypothetical protein WT39_06175 [Burkholderia territorii]